MDCGARLRALSDSACPGSASEIPPCRPRGSGGKGIYVRLRSRSPTVGSGGTEMQSLEPVGPDPAVPTPGGRARRGLRNRALEDFASG